MALKIVTYDPVASHINVCLFHCPKLMEYLKYGKTT